MPKQEKRPFSQQSDCKGMKVVVDCWLETSARSSLMRDTWLVARSLVGNMPEVEAPV